MQAGFRSALRQKSEESFLAGSIVFSSPELQGRARATLKIAVPAGAKASGEGVEEKKERKERKEK